MHVEQVNQYPRNLVGCVLFYVVVLLFRIPNKNCVFNHATALKGSCLQTRRCQMTSEINQT